MRQGWGSRASAAHCVAILAGAVLVTGCGPESDEDAVRRVVTDFYAAIDRGAGDRACDRLTKDARAIEGGSSLDCDEFILSPRRFETPPDVAGVRIGHEHAVARARGGGEATEVFLRREDGRWRIASGY